MARRSDRFYAFGGGALAVSGLLFLLRGVLELMAGAPPSRGAEILVWIAASERALAWISEILFFAAMALVPGVAALYRSLVTSERTKATLGCGALATIIPLLAVLLVVHGRLVYPVYGIRVSTPQVAELTVAIFYGGMHAVDEIMGGATFVLSLAMLRSVYGKTIACLGFVAAALDVAGAYPYAIGPVATLACQTVSSAWLVAVGARLSGFTPERLGPR